MRWLLSMTLALAVATPALAADLTATHRKVVRIHHRAVVRVVRDYDGTPIALRPRPDGTLDAVWMQRASPTRYLNGEPVLASARR